MADEEPTPARSNPLKWNNPTISFGWVLALVILILDCLLKAMGLIELPVAMLIGAVCAVRL